MRSDAFNGDVLYSFVGSKTLVCSACLRLMNEAEVFINTRGGFSKTDTLFIDD
jgi:hypothetical protein